MPDHDFEADSMTEATRPPAYDEVVERYALEILKSPGDLVIKDGDLALTKSGDLMLKNAEYSAMFRLVQGWRFNAPTLQALFDLVFTTKRRRKDLDDSLNGVFADRRFDPKAANPFMPDQSSLDRYHELNDEIGANELASVAYAGAVVLVLSGLLQSFKDDIDATRNDWEKSTPLFEGFSIVSILAASANNFRHNDEWAKTRPRSRTSSHPFAFWRQRFRSRSRPMEWTTGSAATYARRLWNS
jgi:hypothetical protein